MLERKGLYLPWEIGLSGRGGALSAKVGILVEHILPFLFRQKVFGTNIAFTRFIPEPLTKFFEKSLIKSINFS